MQYTEKDWQVILKDLDQKNKYFEDSIKNAKPIERKWLTKSEKGLKLKERNK